MKWTAINNLLRDKNVLLLPACNGLYFVHYSTSSFIAFCVGCGLMVCLQQAWPAGFLVSWQSEWAATRVAWSSLTYNRPAVGAPNQAFLSQEEVCVKSDKLDECESNALHMGESATGILFLNEPAAHKLSLLSWRRNAAKSGSQSVSVSILVFAL
jgi:hypothetical protein